MKMGQNTLDNGKKESMMGKGHFQHHLVLNVQEIGKKATEMAILR